MYKRQENKCSKEIPDQEKSLQEQISLEKRIMDELESWLSAHPYRRGMPKTVLFNQISKGKKEQNREIQKCIILLEEHGNIGCIRLQQENSGIELISPEGYKVKETEEVSKLREIFASQSDGNKVFFWTKWNWKHFLSQQEKRKRKVEYKVKMN